MAVPIEQLIRQHLDNAQVARMQPQQQPSRNDADQDGNRVIVLTQFSGTTANSPYPIEEKGFRLHMTKGGSDPIALKVDMGRAGIYGPLYPGSQIVVPGGFERFSISRWQSETVPRAATFTLAGGFCPDAGQVTLVISKTPNARFYEPAAEGGFVFIRQTEQAINVTTNIPATARDGVNIRGARGIRATVDVDADNITGGSLVWWWFDPDIGVWHQTDVQQALGTGISASSPSELLVAMRAGRLFPELRSLTTTGGTPAMPSVNIYVFGEGGDLSVGDVP
jgi:hypothetical protein